MRTKWFVCCLVVILTACQGGGSTPFPDGFYTKVDVGKYELELFCEGTGEPTIILENDLKLADADFSWASDATTRFRGITRTCTYHRYTPGLSEGEVKGARTTKDQVEDLHNLLKKSGVPGPYILVGYGFGGWNLVLYTQQYPKEVAGLVCVQCMPAGFYKAIFEKPAEEGLIVPESVQTDMQEWKAWFEDWKQNEEHLDAPASSEQVNKVGDLGDRPFVMLEETPPDSTQGEQGTDFIGNLWTSLSKEMCNLSSRCRYEAVAYDAEKDFLTKEVVDQAVREVYEAVKQK